MLSVNRLSVNRRYAAITIVLAGSWAGLQLSRGQSPALSAAQAYEKDVLPVLAKNCFSCHNETLNTAGLNLAAFSHGADAVRQPQVWTRVLARLEAGTMPPSGLPAPGKVEAAAVASWINTLTGKSTGPAVPEGDPGRVTARRLNRVEYNSTVRDLLGVHVKPADEFPVDDSGYGFDNIGDVLTLSPMLMEKYISTARRLSTLAVFGETLPPKPTMLALLMPKKGPDMPSTSASGSVILPYAIRGGMYVNYVFPVDAEYEFRVRVINHRDNVLDYTAPKEQFLKALDFATKGPAGAQEGTAPPPAGGPGRAGGRGGRGRGPRPVPTPEELAARDEAARVAYPPLRMVVTLDGKEIAQDIIEGNTNYKYDRGAVIVRVPVKAGEHFVRASFPDLADLDDARRNINPDGRRRMYIEFAELAGPYNPSPAPPASYGKIFICGHAPGKHNATCARRITENLTQRAFRRPVTSQEIDQLSGLVSLARRQGDTFEEGVRLVVQAVLMSPNFLYRMEVDPKPAPGKTSPAHRINDYELASRLSYFLWSTMPDDELFRVAKAQTLHQPQVLEAQLRRMMADPKATALVDNFAGQWLGVRNLERKPPDPDRFPTVDDELLDYMHRETNLFVSAIVKENRSVLDFIDAPFTYLNGPLAKHYGIPGIKGEDFQRVDLRNTPQRSGILTQGAILSVSSYPTRTSVVTRGRWVLENLLGTPPPPPPPNVPPLADSDIGSAASLRAKMEQHRANPVCASCHKLMDPIGFGLENYDASGAFRTHDGKFPIDSSGVLPDGRAFNGAAELKQTLKAQSGLFVNNLTEKMLTYALGRGVERFDRPTVQAIVKDLSANDYRFSSLVLGIVNSKPFQMRSGQESAQ